MGAPRHPSAVLPLFKFIKVNDRGPELPDSSGFGHPLALRMAKITTELPGIAVELPPNCRERLPNCRPTFAPPHVPPGVGSHHKGGPDVRNQPLAHRREGQRAGGAPPRAPAPSSGRRASWISPFPPFFFVGCTFALLEIGAAHPAVPRARALSSWRRASWISPFPFFFGSVRALL